MGARFIVNSGGGELLRCYDRHRMNSHGSSSLLPFLLSTSSVSLVSTVWQGGKSVIAVLPFYHYLEG